MKGWIKILEELDWPPVYMISPRQFEQFDGDKLSRKEVWGVAATEFPVIAILTTLRGKERDNTIYHELGHHLFPSRPHWWIDLYGEIMAGGGGRGYWAKKFDKTFKHMPTRTQLLVLSRRASARLKLRYKVR